MQESFHCIYFAWNLYPDYCWFIAITDVTVGIVLDTNADTVHVVDVIVCDVVDVAVAAADDDTTTNDDTSLLATVVLLLDSVLLVVLVAAAPFDSVADVMVVHVTGVVSALVLTIP